jgi:hypothetical protein
MQVGALLKKVGVGFSVMRTGHHFRTHVNTLTDGLSLQAYA